MQDYITNNFHGISGMRGTSYILPGRMCGGRTREKSLSFRGFCILSARSLFYVKNPNKKNIFPQSLLRSEINSSCVQGGMPSPTTAQLKVHTLVQHCLQGVTTGKLFQPTLAQSHPKLLLMRCKVTNLSL